MESGTLNIEQREGKINFLRRVQRGNNKKLRWGSTLNKERDSSYETGRKEENNDAEAEKCKYGVYMGS